ncbi:MAG: helicase HerA-like domain-containing protein [Clostridia bacterium]
MLEGDKILIGKGEQNVYLLPSMANRHGLIAGASGTGKTITLKVMAESFSMLGVPVFLADVKGDLAGMCKPGAPSDGIKKRLGKMGFTEFTLTDFPTAFWDVYGERGTPVRTTVSDMGPMLLARLLGLTDVQEGVLNVVFRIADDKKLLLIDLKDLRAMLKYVGDNRAEFTTAYGNVSTQSVGAIQRAMIALEDQGGDQFFGEPALDLDDWLAQDARGRGVINVLDCVKLYQNPTLYAAFMLFLLSDLFEKLPEAGDMDKPKMVFFFDEAHLLFADANKALIQKIEQVAKLIRSKGVGVYFISQSPSDIPDTVLAQLSGRVQHALRAYTPSEQKSIRAAAQSFRENPAFDTGTVLTQLGVGEALCSFLDEDGVPSVVERAMILPPQSLMGTIPDAERACVIEKNPLNAKYRATVDRVSASEDLTSAFEKAQQQQAQAAASQAAQAQAEANEKAAEKARKEAEKAAQRAAKERERMLKPIERAASSAIGSFGRQLGRDLARGLFGTRRR